MAIAGNCANCNRPTNDHHPRCPTLTYPQVDGVYHPRHAAPSFPTVPQARSCDLLGLGEDDYPDLAGPPRRPRQEVLVTNPDPTPATTSVFDAPDAATTHAKQTAHALIHEFNTWQANPGLWSDEAAASWIGQACAVLTELAK
jgi:hypothetical protein